MDDRTDPALSIFAYGSLLWNPGFRPAETRLATLPDYHRSFAMRSVHHRGTEARPGLVLALDAAPGAACRGLALRVPAAETEPVLRALRERELISSAYLEARVALDTEAGGVIATTFVVDRAHRQYCGGLHLAEQAAIIAAAHGGRGPNAEYLDETVRALHALGIEDPELDLLARLVHNRTTP